MSSPLFYLSNVLLFIVYCLNIYCIVVNHNDRCQILYNPIYIVNILAILHLSICHISQCPVVSSIDSPRTPILYFFNWSELFSNGHNNLSSFSDGNHLLLFIAFHTSNTMLTSRWIPESDSPFNSGKYSIDELNAWSIYCLPVVTSKADQRMERTWMKISHEVNSYFKIR